jgi:hypothetical protein
MNLQCRDCGGAELYDTVLSARNGVIIGRRMATGDEWIMVRCAICLNCGNVMPYLDQPGLQRLRGWAEDLSKAAAKAAAAAQQAPAGDQPPGVAAPEIPAQGQPMSVDPANPPPVHDTVGAGFGTIVIACLILGAVLGVLVAVYGIMHQ